MEPRIEWRRLAASLRRERTSVVETAATEMRETPAETRSVARRKARTVKVAQARASGKPARNGRRSN